MNTEKKPDTISEEVQKTVETLAPVYEEDEKYKQFLEYYERLKRLGLTKKQEYDVGLKDTIGRRAYEEMEEFIKNNEEPNPSTRFSPYLSS
jgi:hypothetical protein